MLHGKNLQPFTGAVFVNSLQVLDSLQENPCTYGESVSESFNLRYPGQYADKESGLHFNWMRSYSPNNGRYTQADPIGLQGGWNRFAYANSNPVKYSDPTGLIVGVDDLIIGGGVLVVGCAMSSGCSAAVTNAVSSAISTVNNAASSFIEFCSPKTDDFCTRNQQRLLKERNFLIDASALADLRDIETRVSISNAIVAYNREVDSHNKLCPQLPALKLRPLL